MKRIIALITVLIMCLGLASCASIGGPGYDDITSVFIRRELETENALTSYYYAVHYSVADDSVVHFSAVSFNLDGSITELTNYEVDEQVLVDARKVCKENNVISILKGFDPADLTPDNYTGEFYTVTLQFNDGSEIYLEAPASAEWMENLKEFFVAETDKILAAF